MDGDGSRSYVAIVSSANAPIFDSYFDLLIDAVKPFLNAFIQRVRGDDLSLNFLYGQGQR